jgi:hypothetical protein
MKAFLRAVAAGAVAGAALPMCLTIIFAVDGLARGDPLISMLLLGLFPLLLTLPVVLLAVLTIGLPASALLRRANRESRTAYVVAGVVVGFFLPLVFGSLSNVANAFISLFPGDDTMDVWWIGSFFGALSGAVTANVYWKCRLEPKPG